VALSGEDNVGHLVHGAAYNLWDILKWYYPWKHCESAVRKANGQEMECFVTLSAVSVVIYTGPRRRVGKQSARSSAVRSREGLSPILYPKEEIINISNIHDPKAMEAFFKIAQRTEDALTDKKKKG
jgi:hypothetical protein